MSRNGLNGSSTVKLAKDVLVELVVREEFEADSAKEPLETEGESAGNGILQSSRDVSDNWDAREEDEK